jgi:methyl-accepting chemotaxis protein
MALFRFYTDFVYAVFKRLSIRHLMFMGLFFSVLSALILGIYGYSRIHHFSVETAKVARVAAQIQATMEQLNNKRSASEEAAVSEQKLAVTPVANVKDLQRQALKVGKDADSSASVMLLVMTLCCGAILVIVFNSYLTINMPIRRLIERTKDIAEGESDLTRRLEAMSNTELGELAHWFNAFMTRLQSIVTEVKGSAREVSAATEKTRRISQEALDGVLIQQSEIDQVATAMTEMNATVHEVARSAANAAEAANSADEAAKTGKRVVEDTISVIDNLTGEVENAAEAIHSLEAESENIGNVLSVIKGIAEQTNLLALNAAIEAARAGEQGRGFAVVADEVRTLANRSEQSTVEIHTMISRLQQEASNAVQVMNSGRDKAQETVKQAEKAGEWLNAITVAVNQIDIMNAQIASASEEQSAVAEEINRNIVNINNVATATSDGAKQTAQTSEELAQQSDHLRALVGQFTV